MDHDKPLSTTDWPESFHSTLTSRWQQVVEADSRFEALPEVVQAQLQQVIVISEFATNFCIRYPKQFFELFESGSLAHGYRIQDLASQLASNFSQIADETTLLHQLRLARHRELFCLCWFDLLGLSTLDETLSGLSALADELVSQALDWLYQDQCLQPCGTPQDSDGAPQHLAVIGMGKLGGHELNFSSDIDLIFFFPSSGKTNGRRSLSNEQFFIRLGQRLIKALGSTTADGFVYRIDMRLRPFGESGSLALSAAAMEHYYQLHGREWERYAMIKARIIAGDHGEGDKLLTNLQGFVYRRYLDYSSVESLREMKAMITAEAARKSQGDNIKLGPGGIREVEFIVQLFQLIYGGRDKNLQQVSLQPVLKYLGKRELLPENTVAELTVAYRFLRRVENHLQMMRDQQTHLVPSHSDDQWRLAYAMGFSCWEDFLTELNSQRKKVRQHFDTLFTDTQHQPDDADKIQLLKPIWQSLCDHNEANQKLLSQAGYTQPETALKALQDFAHNRRIQSLCADGRKKLDRLVPLILSEAAETATADVTLERLLVLLATIAQRSVYLSLLLERPQVLQQLTRLFAASPWFRDYLSANPILLDGLIDPETLYSPPDRKTLQQELTTDLARLESDDEEQFLDRLRNFKKMQVFRVAAADIVGALPLIKVSDHLTWIAELLLQTCADAAWQTMIKKSGTPGCEIDGKPYQPQILIIGYGKLGGWELSYGSDLDLVFVHDSTGKKQVTDGERSIHNNVFFARLGQRIIHLMTVLTPAGTVYELDLRLRPGGDSGMLVPSLNAYQKYLQKEAWVWELQALVRARPVAGPDALKQRFIQIRHQILCQKRDAEVLRTEIRSMREAMWQEHGVLNNAPFHLKKSPGGIVDLEFMVQYLVLAHAGKYPQLARWSDNIRILETLAESDVIKKALAERLSQAYCVLRNEIHRRTLNDLSVEVETDDSFNKERQLIVECWQEFLYD